MLWLVAVTLLLRDVGWLVVVVVVVIGLPLCVFDGWLLLFLVCCVFCNVVGGVIVDVGVAVVGVASLFVLRRCWCVLRLWLLL